MQRPSMSVARARLTRGATALFAGLALAANAAAPASADAPQPPSQPTFGLSSIRGGAAITLRAGRQTHLGGALRVVNLTGRRVTVRLQPADIGNSANGNAAYLTSDPRGPGRWLRLQAEEVILPSHAGRDVSFSVAVPGAAAPGAHYLGIVAEDAAQSKPSAAGTGVGHHHFNFLRIDRQALPITVRLPGKLWRRLALATVRLGVEPGGANLLLSLRSSGTELIQGAAAEVRVMRAGHLVLSHSEHLGQLFPVGSLDYAVVWPGSPQPGTYQVTGTIRPLGAPPVVFSRTIRFSERQASHLRRLTPPSSPRPRPQLPAWVVVALAAAGVMLIALTLVILRLRNARVCAPSAAAAGNDRRPAPALRS